jgi:hypothetical protein
MAYLHFLTYIILGSHLGDIQLTRKAFVLTAYDIYLWLYSPSVVAWPLFSFLILYTVGKTPWEGDQPVARPLRTNRTTQTQNKGTLTPMP